MGDGDVACQHGARKVVFLVQWGRLAVENDATKEGKL